MIEVARYEPGIYLYHWRGKVTMDEAEAAAAELAVINEKQPFASIVDMCEIRQLPNNIMKMQVNIRADLREGLCGYVILGAPKRVQAMVRTVAVLAPTTYQFTDDLDEAVTMARALLAAQLSQ